MQRELRRAVSRFAADENPIALAGRALDPRPSGPAELVNAAWRSDKTQFLHISQPDPTTDQRLRFNDDIARQPNPTNLDGVGIQFAGQRYVACIDAHLEDVRAQELFVECNGRPAKVALFRKPIDPTVLHNDLAD